MIEEVIKKLKDKQITFGSIESLTGGLFASVVTSIPGVSQVYKGSIISYASQIKNRVVGVSLDVINQDGVVSYPCAKEMALKGQKLLDVDLCISFTGNAGPDILENKEVGLVYIAIAFFNKNYVYECHFQGLRNEIREKCVEFAFEKINLLLN